MSSSSNEEKPTQELDQMREERIRQYQEQVLLYRRLYPKRPGGSSCVVSLILIGTSSGQN